MNASNTTPKSGEPAFDDQVCNGEECKGFMAASCTKVHPCGHPCLGVRGEEICPPCMQCGKDGKGNPSSLLVSAEDLCSYCFDNISGQPAMLLGCNHVYHQQCLVRMLQGRWTGARIAFDFATCPACRVPIEHPMLHEEIESTKALQEA